MEIYLNLKFILYIYIYVYVSLYNANILSEKKTQNIYDGRILRP